MFLTAPVIGSVLDLGRNSHTEFKHSCTHLDIFVKKRDIVADDKLIVHVETGSNNHPAEVPEAVLPPHYEEWLIKVRMILP